MIPISTDVKIVGLQGFVNDNMKAVMKVVKPVIDKGSADIYKKFKASLRMSKYPTYAKVLQDRVIQSGGFERPYGYMRTVYFRGVKLKGIASREELFQREEGKFILGKWLAFGTKVRYTRRGGEPRGKIFGQVYDGNLRVSKIMDRKYEGNLRARIERELDSLYVSRNRIN